MLKSFQINPYREVIFACIVFGSTGVFVKYIDLPATSIAFFRLAIPTVLIGIWMRYTQKIFWQKGDVKTLLIISTLNALRMYLYFVGFTMTSVGNAVVSLYTGPVFGMLFAVRLLKEKINAHRIISIILAILGLGIIAADKEITLLRADFIGMGAIVLSAIIQGYITVLFKNTLHKYGKISMIFYQCFVGTLVFLPFILFTIPLPTLQQSGIAMTYAFLIGVIGFVLYFSALRKADATVVSILSYTEMVTGLVFAYFLLSEQLTTALIIGALCIVASGLVLRFENKKYLLKKVG